ncbi:sulfonate ABC transporter substrate-binding protein [Robertmurraya korlensis]|uniref:sulfonate ABC transporter substrate-binding protein n=1 Tax=Robertmurraya korlensis TaxID=519977 RepID=UPI0008252272|nr:sulfonate ABC transporter substrate-binding protein [Robertmurraya korlensis]
MLKTVKKHTLSIISLFLMLSLFVVGCSNTSETNTKEMEKGSEKVVTIGYQKNCPLVILKSLQTLEKRLEQEGFQVEWKEFQAGPALVEALNAGSIDFGRTGDSPPIFAQAADAPFVYVAAGFSKFQGSGILVPKNSDIKTLADLKGKTIGFAKGSSSHYLLVKALEKGGLRYDEITPAFLQPGDARVAFEQGNIDAWVVWDPFAADTELNSDATMLVNGDGLTSDRDFFIANKAFAKDHMEILDIIIEEVQASSEWANTHHDELVTMLAPLLKIDEESIRRAVERREYGVDPLTTEIMEEQQQKADTFYELEIIPKKVTVQEAMLD